MNTTTICPNCKKNELLNGVLWARGNCLDCHILFKEKDIVEHEKMVKHYKEMIFDLNNYRTNKTKLAIVVKELQSVERALPEYREHLRLLMGMKEIKSSK